MISVYFSDHDIALVYHSQLVTCILSKHTKHSLGNNLITHHSLKYLSFVGPVDAGGRGRPWCHTSYTSAPCWQRSCHLSSSACKWDNETHQTPSCPGREGASCIPFDQGETFQVLKLSCKQSHREISTGKAIASFWIIKPHNRYPKQNCSWAR